MMDSKNVFLFALLAVGLSAYSATAGPLITYDFETDDFGAVLVNGQHIDSAAAPSGVQPGDTVFEFGRFSNVSSLVGSGGHEGIGVFDSNPAGPNGGGSDSDLLVDSGNILILQSKDDPATTTGANGIVFTTPNDEADTDSGSIVFDFLIPLHTEPQSIDIVDANGGFGAEVILTDINGKNRTYIIPENWTFDVASNPGPGNGIESLDLTSLSPQLGEQSSSTSVSEDAGYLPGSVASLEVKFTGNGTTSGGIDNLVFEIPEPTTLALVVFAALAPLPALRRRALKKN